MHYLALVSGTRYARRAVEVETKTRRVLYRLCPLPWTTDSDQGWGSLFKTSTTNGVEVFIHMGETYQARGWEDSEATGGNPPNISTAQREVPRGIVCPEV